MVPLLEAQGHRVIAPDLPGMGNDNTPLDIITLDSWVQCICELMREQDEKIILLGHSRGGVVISQVAEYVPNHVLGLVYLTAFLVPSGSTLFEVLERYPRPEDDPIDIIFSKDQSTSTVSEKSARDLFYNTTSEPLFTRALSFLGKEPMISYQTPLHLTDENFGSVPRAYIECLQDKAISIEVQRSMLSKIPCAPVFTLPCDHSPFYSAPEELVGQLNTLALKFDTT